jgi:hypothetical protein
VLKQKTSIVLPISIYIKLKIVAKILKQELKLTKKYPLIKIIHSLANGKFEQYIDSADSQPQVETLPQDIFKQALKDLAQDSENPIEPISVKGQIIYHTLAWCWAKKSA